MSTENRDKASKTRRINVEEPGRLSQLKEDWHDSAPRSRIIACWTWVRDLGALMSLCRFSVLMLAAGVIFLGIKQGQDVLRPLAEGNRILTWQLFWFYLSVALWGFNSWYWARVMLRFKLAIPDTLPANRRRNRKCIREWLPRLLGLLSFIAVALAFNKASGPYQVENANKARLLIETVGVWGLGLSFLYTLYALNAGAVVGWIQNSRIGQKKIVKTALKKVGTDQAKKDAKPGYRIMAVFVILIAGLSMWPTPGEAAILKRLSAVCYIMGTLFLVYTIERESMRVWLRTTWVGQVGPFKQALNSADPDTYEKMSDFWNQPATVVALGAFLVLSVILFLMFLNYPPSAVWFGTGSIVLLAAASWIPWGSVVVFVGEHLKLPIITFFIILAVVFSRWNDNHTIRTLGSPPATRVDLGSHFSTWITEGLADWPDDKPYPVFLVAAEGGGIRAAYWPAILLGELQDKNPGFSDHVYAISGVSGGSLGAAVFAALVKGQKTNRVLKCAEGESDQTGGPTRRCAQTVLSKDFLAPTVGYMLYPDMVARFLPVSLESFDRSLGLEESWERAWREAVADGNGEAQGPISNQFGDGFSTLWADGSARVPALFLNSTWVETGKRVIASNVRIDADKKNPTFNDAIDFFAKVQKDVPLSTAVHNSARFMYVSPAGALQTPAGETWGHLVDGGYFENSGATTVFEILREIERTVDPALWARIVPVVLMITNNPRLDDGESPAPGKWMMETRAPLNTLFNTRDARGSYARATLKDQVLRLTAGPGCAESSAGIYLRFRLEDGKGPLPLGWVLSDLAQQNMQRQLETSLVGLEDPLDLEGLCGLADDPLQR